MLFLISLYQGETMDKINLVEKFHLFSDHWNPKIVGELNRQHVKLAKLKGEFVWHHHENEDELFLAIKGQLLMKFRDKDVRIEEGDHYSSKKSNTCRLRLKKCRCYYSNWLQL